MQLTEGNAEHVCLPFSFFKHLKSEEEPHMCAVHVSACMQARVSMPFSREDANQKNLMNAMKGDPCPARQQESQQAPPESGGKSRLTRKKANNS